MTKHELAILLTENDLPEYRDHIYRQFMRRPKARLMEMLEEATKPRGHHG